YQFHGECQQVIHMHAEVIAWPPLFGQWWRWLDQKEVHTGALFRIAQLFIGGANSTKLLRVTLRWVLAQEVKIGIFDGCFAGVTGEPEHSIGIPYRIRKSVGMHLDPPHRAHRATHPPGCVHAAYHAHRAVPTDQRAHGLESATALRPAPP